MSSDRQTLKKGPKPLAFGVDRNSIRFKDELTRNRKKRRQNKFSKQFKKGYWKNDKGSGNRCKALAMFPSYINIFIKL